MNTAQILRHSTGSYSQVIGDEIPTIHLRQEYDIHQELYQIQPVQVRHFLELEASRMADALINRASKVDFMLPEWIIYESSKGRSGELMVVPQNCRQQYIGGLLDRLKRIDIRTGLCKRLMEMEWSADQVISTSSMLIRHAIVLYMVHGVIPEGNPVTYRSLDGEEILSIPSEGRFYYPQWVAFDDKGNLLVKSLTDAELFIDKLVQLMLILRMAEALAPYMVVDQNYQEKRHGILGHLVNQGRALARRETQEIIDRIKKRVASRQLNRGLYLSMPYFDDSALAMKSLGFTVIPFGRVLFTPAFVVLAARQQQADVTLKTDLSASTRKHLVAQLKTIEQAFFVTNTSEVPKKAR